APISSSASEVTISDFDSTEELAITNSRIDGLEAKLNNFEAGSFSETTSLSGSASFQVGAVDESAITEKLTATYSYDLDLNTSFTGDDNLYVGIETGNSSSSVDFTLDSSGDGGDALSVTSMFYQFPLGSLEVAIGPKLDSDDLMPTTTSRYSDSFFFGSQYGLASNYFASQGTGSGVAVARTFDNGFNASGSIIGSGGSTTSGILTAEGIDILTLSLGYDADNYGGGIIYQSSDSLCTLAGSYASSICNDLGITAALDEGYSTTTLGAYYSPGDKTTLSATSSIVDGTVTGLEIDTVTDFQIGVDRELGNGTLSASWKTFPFFKVPSTSGTLVKGDDLGSFVELYYTYNVNDSLSITPGIAITLPAQDAADLAAEGDDLAFYLYDRTAVGVGATFKF
ncbi:porin, partial [Prochlorococcus sp. AH-736-K15]|nr:porin [Prochlorococcus sp. AH-736-K15]